MFSVVWLKMKRSYTQASTQTVGSATSKKRYAVVKVRRQPSATTNYSFVRTGKGFPKKLLMTHTYCDVFNYNTGAAGVLTVRQFRANGMFDPDITGTGHQPYYFDQMSAVYDHYTVIGSRIILRVLKSDNTQYPTTVGIFVNDDSTVTPSITGLLEHPSSVHTIVGNSDQRATLIRNWSAKKTFGGTVLSNDNLQGSPTADPTEQSVFTIFIDSTSSAQQTSVTMDITIEYIAVWDELKDIASS